MAVRWTASSSTNRGGCMLIVNPAGGAGKAGRQWARIAGPLKGQLSQAFQVDEALTTRAGEATDFAFKAATEGASVVVAVGGDGTVNEVANGLVKAQASCQKLAQTPVFAVLPMGTGSDFARTFGWSQSWQDAVERILSGRTRQLDVGQVTCSCPETGQPVQRFFVNMSSSGLGGLAASSAGPYKRLGSYLGYMLATLHAFMTWRNHPCRLQLDGRKSILLPNATIVSVANGRFTAGGIHFAPDADPSDGQFQIVACQGYGILGFASIAHRLRSGTHLSLRGFSTYMAKSVHIDWPETTETGGTAEGPVLFELDGEVLGCQPGIVEMLPGVLRLAC